VKKDGGNVSGHAHKFPHKLRKWPTQDGIKLSKSHRLRKMRNRMMMMTMMMTTDGL